MTTYTQNWGDVDESYVHSIFWEWLDTQPEYTQIANEVRLGDAGQIDLVAKTESGDYVGFEVKVNPAYTGYKDDRITTQFPKYKQSGYLDELYLVGVDDAGYDYLDTFLSDPDRYDGIGVIEIAFELGNEPPLPSVSETTITNHREAEPLERNQTPTLSRQNEAWVQHHVWKGFGDVKEGKLPDPNTKTERQIDILRFEGGDLPTEVLKHDGEVIGIEAKDGELTASRGEKIRQQLDGYVQSGGISQIYLAVPAHAEESAETILKKDGFEQPSSQLSSDLSKIAGLLTVDEAGTIEVVRDATSFEMEHDGYRVDSGSDYLRTMGYGKQFIRPPSSYVSIYEMNPAERAEANMPPFASITQEEYDEPVVWPASLVAKIDAEDGLTKAETVWKYVLEHRDELYGEYRLGTEWSEITQHEKARLALQPESLIEDFPISVSQSYLKDVLEEMSSQGYARRTDGKGSWVPGVDGRVKYFLIPLRIQLERARAT
jgi:hypothetical protein